MIVLYATALPFAWTQVNPLAPSKADRHNAPPTGSRSPPHFNSGYHDDARAMAKHTITAFANSPLVVTPSGSCAATVKLEYVDAVVATDAGCLMNIGGCLNRRGAKVRILHLAELLAQT